MLSLKSFTPFLVEDFNAIDYASQALKSSHNMEGELERLKGGIVELDSAIR